MQRGAWAKNPISRRERSSLRGHELCCVLILDLLLAAVRSRADARSYRRASHHRMLHLKQVETPEEIEIARRLLREYQQALGVDLCFQGFESELEGLPGAYAPPSGRLLLAWREGSPIGCVALQCVDAKRGEMKRLYVRPGARGLGCGRTLVTRILEDAASIGYSEVVLDTLPSMSEAQRLYEQFGFREIASYRPNPIVGSRYLGKKL